MGVRDQNDPSACELRFSVSSDVEEPFSAGLAAGLDPDASYQTSAALKSEPQHLTTTLRSRWLHRLCPVCKHTFRPGDDVLLQAGNKVVHDLPGLRCASSEQAESTADVTANKAFFEGLEHAWPLPEDVPVIQLEPGHWLLAPPRAHSRFSRHACRVCGHSFRAGDRVVICPCDPVKPRCRVAVHRDILQQNHCWDQWQAGDSRDQCLAMT